MSGCKRPRAPRCRCSICFAIQRSVRWQAPSALRAFANNNSSSKGELIVSNSESATTVEGIAVIGLAGRFPGAKNVEEFWSNLKDGVETIMRFSDQELKAAGTDPAYAKLPGFVNAGSVLTDIDQFDAVFFGYSGRDAECIDPQQRLFLECAWECIEGAGYDSESYPGLIGVFGGSDMSSYVYQLYSHLDPLAAGSSPMALI